MTRYIGITGKKSNFMAIIFFILGLIAATGFRLILLLNRISSLWSSIVWYTAVILYIFFYAYRFYIEEKRREVIIKDKLREKIEEDNLSVEDRKKIKVLLDSIMVSKLYWNLLILIILSFIALIIQLMVDLHYIQ